MADNPWTYDASVKLYRNTRTGRFLSVSQMLELRDEFSGAQLSYAEDMAAKLAAGEESIQSWLIDFRTQIKNVFIDEYILARGGRNAMTQSDWGKLGAMIKKQYEFAQNFAEQIAQGEFTEAYIANRMGMYFDSATQAYEHGRIASYGMPDLPVWPAGGTTPCLARCKCYWSIEETDEAWLCSWITTAAESCDGCLDYEAMYAPLTVTKDLTRATMPDGRVLDFDRSYPGLTSLRLPIQIPLDTAGVM
jgi:hypothetical protein